MKREELETLGLEAEQINKVLSLHHAELSLLKDKLEAIDKRDNELQASYDELKRKYEEAAKSSQDLDKLKEQIAQQKEDFQKQEEAIQTRYKAQLKNNIVQRELAQAGVTNPEAVMKLLESDKVTLSKDETKVLGLDAQLEKLKGDQTLSSLFNLENEKDSRVYNYNPAGSVKEVRTSDAQSIYDSINHSQSMPIKQLGEINGTL